ncbi:MAG: hypothetical protein GEV28_16135 [Actinophytocola sp.]|uniref:hypothetical protein n=1 Tax=Actinophytocola sp. TaxID=1872138 RepID=UPI001321BF6C|nr:hypothetical protein [Actinophytocola sp.]MPZ81839.1 hypothetical protein [Actinophytocola sp.]
MLADRFAHPNPVTNMVMGLALMLLLVGLVVFAKPVARLLDRVNLKAMQAQGLADPEPDPEPGPPVLWVGDRNGPNAAVLDRLAVPADVVGDVDEALDHFADGGYTVVVADLSRADPRADRLLTSLRELDADTPLLLAGALSRDAMLDRFRALGLLA